MINLGEYVPVLIVMMAIVLFAMQLVATGCLRLVKGTGRIVGMYNSMCDSLRRAVFMYGSQIYEVLLKYKLAGLNAPVQNIGMLNRTEYSISVAGFIGLWLISRLMLMLVVSCVVMYISVRGRTAERVYMLSLLMVVFGVADALIIYVTQNPSLYAAVTPIVAGIIIVFISLLKIGRAWTGKEKNWFISIFCHNVIVSFFNSFV